MRINNLTKIEVVRLRKLAFTVTGPNASITGGTDNALKRRIGGRARLRLLRRLRVRT